MAAETITEDLGKAPAAAPKKRTSSAARKKKGTRSKKDTAAPKSAEPTARALTLPREIGGLICLALALTMLLAVISFHPSDVFEAAAVSGEATRNWIGPFGARLGNWLLSVFGLGAFCFNALLWYLGVVILVGRRPEWRPLESVGQLMFVLCGTMLAHLTLGDYLFFGRPAGGFVGELGAELLRGFFGTAGAYIITLSFLIASVIFVTDISLSALTRALLARAHRVGAYARHRMLVHAEYTARLKAERSKLLAEQRGLSDVESQAKLAAELSLKPIAQSSYAFEERFEEDVERRLSRKLGRLFKRVTRDLDRARAQHEASPSAAPQAEAGPKPPRVKRRDALQDLPAQTEQERWELGERDARRARATDPAFVQEESEQGGSDQVDDASSATMVVEEIDLLSSATISPERDDEVAPVGEEQGDFGPRIVKNKSGQERDKRIKELLAQNDGEGVLFKPQQRGDFSLPAISFLNYEDANEDAVDIEQLRAMAARIEKTLSDFKVEGQIRDICPGPVITVFEFSPAPGVKISKIANLSDDLAMALAALSVRIVAPIPGKGVVGIEVPNPSREIVYMKEIIADKVFYENQKMALPMGLGKDTSGNPVVTDLAKMPHLLVAGATGSGKSVAVNTMITSLLYKNSPDDVRLIMVDPKMLEFSIYADIPHLLLPVVTDPKQATVALNWAVQEMERRYQKLADLNVRNIKGYNAKVAKLTAEAEQDLSRGEDDTKAIRALALDAKGQPEHVHLPYIVVIIDEFADLMMTASKDVETAVARLAQKARAAGLHLILATQRPSTDVITGLIKANFPTRIALRVTSKTDSRVILDSNGAENLLGNGDMLFVPPGTSHVQRVHGAYVSEKEIELMVDFLKTQGQPQYNEAILQVEDEEGGGEEEPIEHDEHYEDAVRLVVESRQASISMIQRKLRVGYNRAARMVEVMEREGLVSPPDSCKPREVLVDVSPY